MKVEKKKRKGKRRGRERRKKILKGEEIFSVKKSRNIHGWKRAEEHGGRKNGKGFPHSFPGAILSFTLVELIVVIAVIALLAALLLPAMRAAKDKVYSISCMSNLRQNTVGFLSYGLDYNGWLPSSISSYYSRSIVDNKVIGKYLGVSIPKRQIRGKPAHLMCPAIGQRRIHADFQWTVGAAPNGNITFGYAILAGYGSGWWNFSWFGRSPNYGTDNRQLVNLNHAGKKNIFWDGRKIWSESQTQRGNFPSPKNCPFFSDFGSRGTLNPEAVSVHGTYERLQHWPCGFNTSYSDGSVRTIFFAERNNTNVKALEGGLYEYN